VINQETQAKPKPLKIQPVQGTRDFYPDKMRWRNWLFEACRQVSELYGYEEYDGPFIEYLDLYAAKSGEELVNEQTYTFESRGGEKLAVRPEMTPTLARMVAARQNELRKPIRWFTIPNVWRYERPQRGRKREFYQYNIDGPSAGVSASSTSTTLTCWASSRSRLTPKSWPSWWTS
jgi:histidyl-tRNA synthetase